MHSHQTCSMSGFEKWQLRSALGVVVSSLRFVYDNYPEAVKGPALVGSGWSYKQWAYFYAAKGAWPATDGELGSLVKAAGSDLRDFLLAFAIRTYTPARTVAFGTQTSLSQLLNLVSQVVLARIPQEFSSIDWVQRREAEGTKSLLAYLA